MKRIIFLTLAIFVLLGSVSVFALDSYYPDYEIKAADEFRAICLPITNLANPVDKLQNMMDIEFVHGREIYDKYVSASYASIERSDYTTTYRFNDSYFSHEEKPHLPGVSKQWDVAAGVGLTTAGIVIVNTLTNSSVFGSASFNGSFNPQASPSVQPGSGSGVASGSTGSAASTGLSGTSAGMTSAASTAQGSAASSLSQGAQASAGGSNLIKGISDFFKGLFEVLRDMLTDEGRSYASGKITDLLSETDLTNLGDKE